MVDEAQRHRTTFDPREQAIMQQGMFSQLEDTGYSIGQNYQGDEETSGLGSFLLTPFKKFHENVGGRINANEPYYNPPGGKTTTWRDPNSLVSSPWMGMAIGAALRGKGEPGAEKQWNKIPYGDRLKEVGIPYNELPSSTFSPNMSRYENTLGFSADLGDLFGLNLGDFDLTYDYDLDDNRQLLELLYSLKF